MNDLDQKVRMIYIILMGFQRKPRTRPGAAKISTEGSRAVGAAGESVESQVRSFLTSKGIFLDLNTIEICHPLSRGNGLDKPAI